MMGTYIFRGGSDRQVDEGTLFPGSQGYNPTLQLEVLKAWNSI